MSVKTRMRDEAGVMGGWDINSVDPCTWFMVGCSSDGFVISLSGLLFCCFSPLCFTFQLGFLDSCVGSAGKWRVIACLGRCRRALAT